MKQFFTNTATFLYKFMLCIVFTVWILTTCLLVVSLVGLIFLINDQISSGWWGFGRKLIFIIDNPK